jgi:hypothetical protein
MSSRHSMERRYFGRALLLDKCLLRSRPMEGCFMCMRSLRQTLAGSIRDLLQDSHSQPSMTWISTQTAEHDLVASRMADMGSATTLGGSLPGVHDVVTRWTTSWSDTKMEFRARYVI